MAAQSRQTETSGNGGHDFVQKRYIMNYLLGFLLDFLSVYLMKTFGYQKSFIIFLNKVQSFDSIWGIAHLYLLLSSSNSFRPSHQISCWITKTAAVVTFLR